MGRNFCTDDRVQRLSCHRRRNRGSILIQFLMTLLMSVLFLQIGVQSLKLLASVSLFPASTQDLIGIAQLRRFLNGCKITSVSTHELQCENDREWVLRCSKHNLYLGDGTIIVLESVNEVVFEVDQNNVWMQYHRNNESRKVLIGYVR